MRPSVALDSLLAARRVWRGKPQPPPVAPCPSGWDALDAALPSGGWPPGALTELLLPADGVGELRLLWPTLARLSRQDGAGVIALVAPPYLPYPPAWAAAGVQLPRLQLVRCEPRDALWAAEQCLRSAACAAVLCWPHKADDRALRRLQVAAESGQCLGFALRPVTAAANPSPAALRIAIDTQPSQLRVLKCRGGNPPAQPIPFATKDACRSDVSRGHAGNDCVAEAQHLRGIRPPTIPGRHRPPVATHVAPTRDDTCDEERRPSIVVPFPATG